MTNEETQSTFGPVGQPGSEPLHVGERIDGKYVLTRLIGRGATSSVYEAEDVELSRRVAVKVVDDPQLGADILLREAKALVAIRHPGLPIVFGVGIHEGWTFLLMERVFGVTLEEHLDQARGRPFSLVEGLTILGSIAEVLAAVHGGGMAHRDLKPANVMLSPGRTVLLDFGIVLPEVNFRDGGRAGTPRYLAPEVILDDVKPGHSHLVDTYAFGIMAFEMFAGAPPFVADNVIALMEHHIATPPPHLGSLRPDLPSALCELVLACMAKVPADRPPDMQAVTWELRNFQRVAREGSGPVHAAGVQSPRETYRRQEPARADVPSTPWEVLIVDDDDENRDGLAVALKERGFRARVATDGRDALDLIRRTGWRPSVILLDLMMPVMDGYQFLAMQSGDPMLESIPVLVTSARPTDEVRKFSAVRGVLSKPVAIGELLQEIEGVCRQRHHSP